MQMKRLFLTVVVALIMPFRMVLAATDEVVDDIWTPSPESLILKGEPHVIVNDNQSQASVKKHFLVAGSNATATVTIGHYSGKWKAYDLYGLGLVKGAFRHTIEKIVVLGYAAAELNDIPIPDYNGMSEAAYAEAVLRSKAGKMFKQGKTIAFDFDGVSGQRESARGLFTTAARHDVEITVNVEKIDEEGEAYRIVDIIIAEGTNDRDRKCFASPQRELWPEKTGRGGVFEFPFIPPIGAGRHGQYYWTAFVCYTHEWYTDTILGRQSNEVRGALNSPNGDKIMTEGLEAQLLITDETGWVFFDKYGKDNNRDPNWFTYWKEDGACPCLKGSAGKMVLGGTDAVYGLFDPKDRIVHLQTKVEYRNGIDLNGPAAFHYPYGYRFTHKTFPSQSYRFPEKGGGTIYGIYTVEEVVMHELFHEKLDELYKELHHSGDNWISKLAGNLDSDKQERLYTWPECIKWNSNGICDVGVTKFHDPWCDFLVDFEEDWYFGPFSEFNLDMYDTDTYNLKDKDGQYGAYGDNEFLCMIEANKASRRTVEEGGADPSKDWAFPGEQSYRPTPPPQNSKNQTVKGLLLKESTSGQSVINLMGLTTTFDRDTSGLVSAIRYSLEMQVSGIDELVLHATLADKSGTPAAIAYASISEGPSVVDFRFEGRDVFESGLTGPFRLSDIVISEFDGNDSAELATLTEFKDAEVDVRREDLVRNEAYLLDVVDETVTTNGIVVSVNIEVNTAGEYGLAATLVNTNGVPVASASMTTNCAQGTNRVSVVFAANEILQSDVDGPYTIDNLVLFKDGERVDSRLYFYSLRKKYRAQAFDFDGETDIDAEEFMAQFEDCTPPSEIPPPERFWVFFNPNGGTASETIREVIGGEKVGALPIPTLENDEFLGWYTELEGGTRISDSTIVTTNVMCHARWKNGGTDVSEPPSQEWTVTFDATGGTVSPATRTVVSGAAIGSLPTPTRSGYMFVGWFTATSGGAQVTDSTKMTADITYYAHWTANGSGEVAPPGPTPEPTPEPGETEPVLWAAVPSDAVSATAATTYDGYLYKDKTIAGTIQVKVGKPNAKTGLAAVKAVVTGLHGKKNLKAENKGKAEIAADGASEITLVGGEACKVTLGAKGMSGRYGAYTIDGSLNVFASKDAGDKAVATAALGKWQGAVNVAWEGAQGWNGLSVAIAARGKAKVSGTLADGTKVSANSQLLVGEEWCCVPVVEPKKAKLAFVVWLPVNGADAQERVPPRTVGLGEGVKVGKPGSLKGGAKFRIDADVFSARWGQRALPSLPNGVAITEAGGRWTLPKAGKVIYERGTTNVDPTKTGENPSALKLTYKAKDGTFKGSFKAYADVNGKPKATTVNVTGVMIGNVGYGAATVKKVGGVPVTVE